MANLANKYRPKDFSSIVEQSLVVDMIRKFCESPELDTRNFLLIGPAGTGKAQPLYSKVLTPNGYIEMRDVHKGTEVFTHTGAVAKVSAIFPQGELDVYQINLADGGSIRVADNHLNIFNIEESGVSKRYTMSTIQLIKRFGGKTRSETFTVDNLVYDDTNHCVVQLAEKRIMQSIHYVGKEECQCIFVSHKDHTYISDCCIPTHNTTTARIMANVLNEDKGGYIELDAASNGSAESIRELIQQARQYPVGMNYRILIVDECFSSDMLISTPNGAKPISSISVGDSIYNMQGVSTVKSIFKNTVRTEDLLCVTVSGNRIITTKNHLFFTDTGWVESKNLKQGDVLYDCSTMQTMWKRFRGSVRERQEDFVQQGMSQTIYTSEISGPPYKCISKRMSDMWKEFLDSEERECNNLLNELWCSVEKTTSKYGEIVEATCKTLAYVYLSGVWKTDGNSEQGSSYRMFSEMRQANCYEESPETDFSEYMSMVWKYIYSELSQSKQEDMFGGMSFCINGIEEFRTKESEIFGKNAEEQSDVRSRDNTEDDGYKTSEWNITSEVCSAWWERALHSTTDYVEGSTRTRVDIRVSGENHDKAEQQSESVPYELQIRPCLSRPYVGYRGGWCYPSLEIATAVGREKGEVSDKFRVDSVEIYKRGSNDELFRSSFTDSELSKDYITMYDLEVTGHPSYYVNDVLVHNCHSLSSTAWQSLLKTLEESPAKSLFIFLTTNPEKIPATILSRVQTFQLSKISVEGITNRLKYIIDCENKEGRNITYTEDAIQYVAKYSGGGLRDALTTLDKVLAYSEEINSENLMIALNLPEYDDYFALLGAYSKHDNESIAKIIDKVYNSGVNFVKWFEGFHSFVINITKFIFIQDINATMIPAHYADKLTKYNVKHANVCLKLASKLLKLVADLKTTSYLQEVALTYLCSPQQVKENSNG